jgi:hypothetical protein
MMELYVERARPFFVQLYSSGKGIFFYKVQMPVFAENKAVVGRHEGQGTIAKSAFWKGFWWWP